MCPHMISTIIQFATLFAEFRSFLERTISGVDVLEMALKDGIVALSKGHRLASPHILYNKSKLTCKQSMLEAISNLTSTLVMGYRSF